MKRIARRPNSGWQPQAWVVANGRWPGDGFAKVLRKHLSAAPVLAALICGSPAAAATPDFAARFADPPAEARIIKIIHNWPDAPQAQDGLIERLQKQGFGGVVCNVSSDRYLRSDEKWTAFVRAVRQAKAAGMALWLYDERGYPSGNAGGLVLQDHPDWEARGLLVADRVCEAGPLELEVPPGRLVLAAGCPIREGRIDLAAATDLKPRVRDGRLRWNAPEGRWHVMVFTESRLYEGTHADGNLHEKMPYINLLMPEPTRRFIEVTHQAYAERLGKDLGSLFVSTFTDEPSLMSCFLRPMPWRPLPWAPNLPVEFQKRRGYALENAALPALIGDAGAPGARLRYDFWLTVGELVSENFFGQIQERCAEWRIPSGGHLLAEEGLVGHVPFYGDFFRCIRRLDTPSIDCLTSVPPEVPWFIARMLASAAELDGRRFVMSETSDHGQVWRGPGDNRPKRVVTETEIRGTCNRLVVSGVNAITSYYSFRDLPDDALRRLNEWVGRCCASLAGGHQVADVALLYPVESIWPKFHPARNWAGDSAAASAIENAWRGAAESLFAAQREFTMIDSRTLAEAKAAGGALAHRDLRWRVLVLPGVDTLPETAWANLERFVRGGGVVVALGALPANTEKEFPSGKIVALGRTLFGDVKSGPSVERHGQGAGVYLPAGSEGLLPVVLDGLLDRDVAVTPPRSPLRATHRRIDGHEVYFVINDSAKPWRGDVTLSAAGPGEQWNPDSGSVARTNLGTRVALDLQPYGATLLRFPGSVLPKRRQPATGELPNLVEKPVPEVKPARAQGEFVRAEIVPDAERSGPGRPAWRASSALTKAQVDTFMFVRFLYPDGLDFSGGEALALDVWIPEGQQTGAQLLAILNEKDGGDFFASTGCSLAAPGRHRVFVPIQRLQLAGWSQDADGELDLTRVAEVRIGWGGYYGKEGETVEFSVGLPGIGYRQQAIPGAVP